MTSGPNDRPNSGPSHKIGLPIYNRAECYSLITEVDVCLSDCLKTSLTASHSILIKTLSCSLHAGVNFHYILELIDVISQYFF